MTIREELLNLKDDDGLLVPEVVLGWARTHKKSALHSAINWDTNYNVEAYLLLQVRNLITLNIRDERRAPEMISLSIDRSKPNGGYREIAEVLDTPDLRKVMLSDALHELDLLHRRFEELEELAPIWAAVEAVRRPPPRRGGARTGAPVSGPRTGRGGAAAQTGT